jgi:hypothetical protein
VNHFDFSGTPPWRRPHLYSKKFCPSIDPLTITSTPGERILGDALEFASLAPQASERLALKTVLDSPPRLVRIRVPSEFQDVKPSGAVIELGVDPRAPAVGGFRLDALGLARRVPAFGGEEGFEGLGVSSGDEMAAAAVSLTVRVYAVQVSEPVF